MQLDCIICCEIMIEPVVGECGHTVCTPCRQKMKDKCPTCCKVVKYQKNFTLRDIIQEVYGPEYDKKLAEWLQENDLDRHHKKRKPQTKLERQRKLVDTIGVKLSSQKNIQLVHETAISNSEIEKLITEIILNDGDTKALVQVFQGERWAFISSTHRSTKYEIIDIHHIVVKYNTRIIIACKFL